LTYNKPCVRCGSRVIAILDTETGLPYIQCVDFELGFSDPSAIEGPGGEVFNEREQPIRIRPATADDLACAGWSLNDFLPAS
jgi:hypothetical protein